MKGCTPFRIRYSMRDVRDRPEGGRLEGAAVPAGYRNGREIDDEKKPGEISVMIDSSGAKMQASAPSHLMEHVIT
jgi:hypothetical protein